MMKKMLGPASRNYQAELADAQICITAVTVVE
jgi:hypothetical protein